MSNTWDIHEFENEHLPNVVAQLNVADRRQFSQRTEEPIRVLDMPIYMPQYRRVDNSMRLPGYLGQFARVLNLALWAEWDVNQDWGADHYVYITVDQGLVQPATSQRRPGWHTDAFVVDDLGVQQDVTVPSQLDVPLERTYLMYDAIPTLFHPGPFSFENYGRPITDEGSMLWFDHIAESSPQEIRKYPPYSLLQCSPYDVHAVGVNDTDKPIFRTFMKIQISRERFNREGNTHNHLFDYDWPMVPRDPNRRQHRSAVPA